MSRTISVEAELILQRHLLERGVLPTQIDAGRQRPGEHALVLTFAARAVSRSLDGTAMPKKSTLASNGVEPSFGRWMFPAAEHAGKKYRELLCPGFPN